MPAPSVTILAPPPLDYFDPGILRPTAHVKWTGGTGPFDVTHEWDTDSLFPSPIQDVNTGATSPDVGTPPSDMGPAGTTWYYRVTVEDTSDATSTTIGPLELNWSDPITFQRFLHLLANAGVGYDPIDTPAAGWDPESHGGADAGDGYAITFQRFLHLLANITTDVPTPHIWYVYPDFGREGWEFKIIGYGFGNTQGTYNGSVLLNALGCSVIDWQAIAETSSDLTIDPESDTAEPVHEQVRAIVPAGAESGLVYIVTDA